MPSPFSNLNSGLLVFVLFCCSNSVLAQWIIPNGLKYSYGIVAPVQWTVGAYIWYIGMLGLVLGALLLLFFIKGWKGLPPGYGYFDRSYHYQRAFGDSGIFDKMDQSHGNLADHRLFWADRIQEIAEKFTGNR